MTWVDGFKHLFSTYCVTPRMWPVGYIIASPYSPLRVERDMPSRNWRDAFEDLLAHDATGALIPGKVRKAQDEYAAKTRFEAAKRAIAVSNHNLKSTLELVKLTQEARQRSLRAGDYQTVQNCDNILIPNFKARGEWFASEVQKTKMDFEKIHEATGSSAMPRGQWIASIINSRAMPAWEWVTYGTVEGPAMVFSRTDPTIVADIGISESNLAQMFEQGQPYNFSPSPIPPQMYAPITNGAISNDDSRTVDPDPWEDFLPSPSSIMVQGAKTEAVKLPDGTSGTKVSFEYYHANGTTSKKEFVEEPLKVLEEMENARKSMHLLKEGIESQDNLN
ncbi:hypothetical protein G7Y79_00015g038240 [Physcia stellaris]|nr:hypothetical protein G7Y79_00015g038240 [Physcia stellaris]